MKERLPALIALALLVNLVVLTWWAADYAQRAVSIDPPARLTHEPDAWGQRIVMLRTDPKGLPINRLEGDYMEHFPDDDSYEITQPRATGLRADNPVTIGTANKAVIDQDGLRITLHGNARLHRVPDAERDALDVYSEQIVLLTDQDQAHTDLPAEVQQGRSRMNGTGMRYNNRTRQLVVHASTNVEIAAQDARSRRSPSDASSSPARQP